MQANRRQSDDLCDIKNNSFDGTKVINLLDVRPLIFVVQG